MTRGRRKSVMAVGLAVLAGATMGQESCDTSTEDPQVEKGGGGGSGGGKTAQVGDKLTLKGTTYRVTDVSTASQLGDQSIGTGAKANGKFIIVNLALTNRKNEPATIVDDNIRVIGGNGKSYTVSDDALFAVEDQSFLLEEIQPDVTEKGTLVYDVPKKAVKGAKLQVQDLFSDSKGRFELGL